jgi:hypothetical protein
MDLYDGCMLFAMFDCLCILVINVLSGLNTEFYNVKADYLELPLCF